MTRCDEHWLGKAQSRVHLMSKTEVRLSCAEIVIRIIRPRPPSPTPIVVRFIVPTSAVARAASSDVYGPRGVIGGRQNFKSTGRVAQGHRIPPRNSDQNRKEDACRGCRDQNELVHNFTLPGLANIDSANGVAPAAPRDRCLSANGRRDVT